MRALNRVRLEARHMAPSGACRNRPFTGNGSLLSPRNPQAGGLPSLKLDGNSISAHLPASFLKPKPAKFREESPKIYHLLSAIITYYHLLSHNEAKKRIYLPPVEDRDSLAHSKELYRLYSPLLIFSDLYSPLKMFSFFLNHE